MWRVMVIVALMTGCARGPLPTQPHSQSSVTMPTEQLAVRPVAPATRHFTQGEVLYIRHCADCHGWEGRGNGPLAQLLEVPPPPLRGTELSSRYTEAELVVRVLLGKDLTVPLASPALSPLASDVNALVAHLQRLPAIPWAQVNEGQEQYDALCVSCHGIYGRGDGPLASALPSPPRDLGSPAYQNQVSNEELFHVISHGSGAMPGVADVLSPDEIHALVAFTRILSPGYELYDRFCAVCHGPDGHPFALALQELLSDIPMQESMPAFDNEYFRTHTDEHVRTWTQHMLQENRAIMPHFSGTLNAEEVRQILTYLRTLPPES